MALLGDGEPLFSSLSLWKVFRDSSHFPSTPGAPDRIVQLDAQAFMERLSFV